MRATTSAFLNTPRKALAHGFEKLVTDVMSESLPEAIEINDQDRELGVVETLRLIRD